MPIIDVLSEKDINQLGQQLRALFDGGYLSTEANRVVDKLIQASRQNKFHLQGTAGKVGFDLTFWAEPKV